MSGAVPARSFCGIWQIRRRIDDAMAAQTLHVTGRAVLEASAPRWVWQETVEMRIPGRATPLAGHRRYLWQPDPRGIDVFFGDGRFFHRIDLCASEPGARHDCAPDTYIVSYDFSTWPRWQSAWQVTGPRKSYVMTTCFARADPGAAKE